MNISDFIKSQSANTLRWYIKNLIDIYNDNWSYIIDAQLRTLFISETYSKMMPFITKEFNLFKSVVNSVSQVYKNKAIREAKVNETIDEVYKAAIDDARLDGIMRTANRMSNALRHVLIRPRLAYDALRYDVLTFDNCSVLFDEVDVRKIVGVQYFTGLRIPDYDTVMAEGSYNTTVKATTYKTGYKGLDGISTYNYEDYTNRHVWTLEKINGVETTVYRRYDMGTSYINKKPLEEISEEKVDVYRDTNGQAVMPFVLVSAEDSYDGELCFTKGTDIIDACIGIAIDMVHYYHVKKLQSFKQVVLSGDADKIPNKIISDPSSWATVPKDTTINVLELEAKILDLWQAIKERIVMVLAQYGIPPNDFLQTASPSSGFAKLVENSKLIEKREQDLPRYTDYETELYNKTVVVWNTDKSPMQPAMSTEAQFYISFGNIGLPVDVQTIVQEETHDLMNGIITPVDIIMRRNAGMSRTDAEAVYIRNKQLSNATKVGTVETGITIE